MAMSGLENIKINSTNYSQNEDFHVGSEPTDTCVPLFKATEYGLVENLTGFI